MKVSTSCEGEDKDFTVALRPDSISPLVAFVFDTPLFHAIIGQVSVEVE